MKELSAPPNLESDPEATEVLRAWVVNGQLECSLQIGAFDNPEIWGKVLVDLIRHLVLALEEKEGRDPQDTVNRILAGFEEELSGSAEDPDEEDAPTE